MGNETAHPKRLRIGECVLDLSSGELERAGLRTRLPEQPFRVLELLAAHPHEVVSRELLKARLWPKNSFVDFDTGLNAAVRKLRAALNDDAEAPRYIETLPRRGYRCVAEVEVVAPPEPASTAGAENAPEPGRAPAAPALIGELRRAPQPQTRPTRDGAVSRFVRRTPAGKPVLRRNFDIVIIGALSIALGVLGYRAFMRAETGPETLPQAAAFPVQSPANSIAVLRFLNLGGEPHFADGLGEELLDRLAHLKELGVAARTSSWAFSGSDADVPTIARQLDVNYVLEGSVRQSGDQIRVTAQLNDGRTGKHVWSQSYDRRLTTDTFFETQSDIARQVVSLLTVSLSPESEDRLSGRPQTSMEALEFYLQGQEYFRKPHSNETLDTAAQFFRRALELDPRFAMAYAGLCDTELGRYIITGDVTVFSEAERACHRALTLDDDMPRVLAALGGLYLFSGQNEKAEEELRRAIEENPNLIEAYADLGEALENQGRIEEAEQVFRTMVARQPGYWYSHNALGNYYYRQSRFEDAAKTWEKVIEIAPDRALGFNNLATAYYMLGDFTAASSAYEKSVQIEPYADNYSNLGLAYYYDGRYADAAEMQLKALELRPADAGVLGRLATAYQFMGRKDEAIVLYSEAIELIRDQLVINPIDIRLNRYLAVFSASIGRMQAAQAAIARALELQPHSSGVQYDAAKIALANGDREAALNYLEQAKNFGYSVNIIRADPVFTALHDDARFVLVAQDNNNGRER